jgi:predicted MPP superfamily phosphohydrolase
VQKKWRIGGLPIALDGIRILHVTDFHLDFDPSVVGRLRKVLKGLEYDVVCLTGDFFDLVFEEEKMDLEVLDELILLFRKPIYAVLGNHDILAVAEELEKRGVRVLMNESEMLGGPVDGLMLAGIDDPRQYRTDSVQRALENRPEGCPVVLLAHSPQVYQDASAHEVDLMLSGHTHGGQICLPGGTPISSRFNCPRKMISGAWSHGDLRGYTAHGCGGCKLPYRLNSPAEVTIHTLRGG